MIFKEATVLQKPTIQKIQLTQLILKFIYKCNKYERQVVK